MHLRDRTFRAMPEFQLLVSGYAASGPATLNPPRITISAWARSTGATSGTGFIVNKGYDGSSIAYSLNVFASASGLEGMAVYNGSFHSTGTPGTAQGDGNWHHHCGTADGAKLSYYLDGVFYASVAFSGALPVGSAALEIGRYNNDNARFVGDISEVRIFDYALSPAQVAREYADPFWRLRPPRRQAAYLVPTPTPTPTASPAALLMAM